MKRRFLAAADTARTLLDRPELVEGWDRPSALDRMTVGALCAHLSRAVTMVPGYLATHGAPPLRDAPGYFLALSPSVDTDLDAEMATAVRSRATEQAAEGAASVTSNWDRARRDLDSGLDDRDMGRAISVLGSSMPVVDYLVTRLVELVVHADDLAASLGVAPPTFEPAVTDTVVSCLIAIASRRHSPMAVIRAMTRVERADPAVLRVF